MAAEVFIDGVEIDVPLGGTYALTGSVTRRLNRPSQATIRCPMWAAGGGAGSRLKIVIDGTLKFHGFVTDVETDTDEDAGYTTYNATDPMELWQWRPVRDYDGLTPGNFVDPYILKDKVSGPQIVEAMMLASENPAGIPETAEGPLFLEYGDFETGGQSMEGAPATWPMTMMELTNLMTSTGELDVIIEPIDSGGNMGRLSAYNGNYGDNLSGSVIFQYGFGSRNVRRVRWTQDLSNVSNKIQYFFGPKETIRRYKSNITGDDPCGPVQIGSAAWANLLSRRFTSRTNYGVRMEIQEYDVDVLSVEQEPVGTCVYLDPVKKMYRVLWYLESWIRCVPREIIHITPIRGVHYDSFDVGDRVRVSASPDVRGGFDGVQRIYEFTVSWGEDGVIELSELQTSADQEGA